MNTCEVYRKWFDLLIEHRQLEKIKENYPQKRGKYFYVEGIRKFESSDSTEEENMMVYDCSNDRIEFDYKPFVKAINAEKSAILPVLVFNDWAQERSIYWSFISQIKNAADRKDFIEWFEKKYSLYIDCGESVSLDIDNNGINYLQYDNGPRHNDSDAILTGLVYNIDFFELKKLFNITGAHLFNGNVRYGLKHSTGETLKLTFKQYLINAIQEKYHMQELECVSAEEDAGSSDAHSLNDSQAACVVETEGPGNFWFCHNGITIFCVDDDDSDVINTTGSKIVLNPNHVSVINGAQTLTNFFAAADDIAHNELRNLNENRYGISNEKIIENAMKKIYVKVSFIRGNSKFQAQITKGLNTQIPILEESLLADSDTVSSINKKLSKYKIKILKDGELWTASTGLRVLDFTKYWLTVTGKPGASKNLNKNQLGSLLKGIEEDLYSDSGDKIAEKLPIAIFIYQWWANTQNSRMKEIRTQESDGKISSDEAQSRMAINRFGRNYFAAYVTHSNTSLNDIDDSRLTILFDQFVEDIQRAVQPVELETFKKDDATSELFKSKDNREIVNQIDMTAHPNVTEDLTDLLKREGQSQYTFFNTINRYLVQEGVQVAYFRVISRKKGKCCEAYPFPNSTFGELIKSNSGEYPTFENSSFYTEVQRNYPVFIIDKDASSGAVLGIHMINDFSFSKYSAQAQEVYEKTVSAFQAGDEFGFPRSSDNLGFHVRPKAINSEDTFEFTNGEFITKRTFWANKNTVDEIIGEKLSSVTVLQ